MSTTDFTITKDTYLDEYAPTTVRGTGVSMSWGNNAIGKPAVDYSFNPILYVDASAFDNTEDVVTAARVWVYVWTKVGAGLDKTNPYRLYVDDDDWTEAQATWNNKDQGKPTGWGGDSVPGGQVVANLEALDESITATGWQSFDVGAVAVTVFKLHSGIFDFLGWPPYNAGSSNYITFYSHETTAESPPGTPLKPYLQVTHEPRGRQVCGM